MLRFCESSDPDFVSSRQELAPENLYSWDLYRLGHIPSESRNQWAVVFLAGEERDDEAFLIRLQQEHFSEVQILPDGLFITVTFKCHDDLHVRRINQLVNEAVAQR